MGCLAESQQAKGGRCLVELAAHSQCILGDSELSRVGSTDGQTRIVLDFVAREGHAPYLSKGC